MGERESNHGRESRSGPSQCSPSATETLQRRKNDSLTRNSIEPTEFSTSTVVAPSVSIKPSPLPAPIDVAPRVPRIRPSTTKLIALPPLPARRVRAEASCHSRATVKVRPVRRRRPPASAATHSSCRSETRHPLHRGLPVHGTAAVHRLGLSWIAQHSAPLPSGRPIGRAPPRSRPIVARAAECGREREVVATSIRTRPGGRVCLGVMFSSPGCPSDP